MNFLADWEGVIRTWLSGLSGVSDTVTFITRFFFPLLALTVFLRCLWPLMSGGRRPSPWAYLVMPDNTRLPLVHWENSVGRGKHCDVVIDIPTISRNHAVITRKRDGWYVADLDSRGGVLVGGQTCQGLTRVNDGDYIQMADVLLNIVPADSTPEPRETRRTFAVWAAQTAQGFKQGVTLLYILFFQFVALIDFCLAAGERFSIVICSAYLLFMLLECIYFLLTRRWKRRYIEPELLAFFLCGIGLFVAASKSADALAKQVVTLAGGLVLFLLLTFFLNNFERTRRARYVFAVGALVLLAVNLVIGQTRFGARNWISVASFSFQPSEFVKVAFVFAGAATLDRLLTRRNLLLFMGFSAACMGALALMRDFGTAAVFFSAFLVMTFMRSGDVRIVGAATAVTGAGALLAVSLMPYIMDRFEAWRHVWAFADTTGYQQTRTMVYAASGGLTGVGPGRGYLINVAAADTDLVFGILAEEWGLLIALICVLSMLALAVFSFMSVRASRSSLYAIAACGASVILLTQTALNVFGSMDILPLTGVTLPFISNGGSSMMACWGLLACIKSVDERHRAKLV